MDGVTTVILNCTLFSGGMKCAAYFQVNHLCILIYSWKICHINEYRRAIHSFMHTVIHDRYLTGLVVWAVWFFFFILSSSGGDVVSQFELDFSYLASSW